MRTNVLAPHMIRLYVWNLLSNNTALSTIPGRDGVELIPVAPVSDEPDLRDSGKTYLIYGFIEDEPRMSVLRRGMISFRIVSTTFAELSEIIGVLTSAFEIEDYAAANINQWSTEYQGGLLQGTRFTSACVTYVEAADAEELEGGPITGTVNIDYRYVAERPVKLYQSGGTWV